MENTPKSLRLQVALFGRTNVGKSSFLNMICGQDVAITSPIAGTTTDVVEKAMELLPLGPVLFLDTAGIDDATELGRERVRKTLKVFDRADIAVILCEAGAWGEPEEKILRAAAERSIPVICVVNKADLARPDAGFREARMSEGIGSVVEVSSVDETRREQCLADFKQSLIDNCPEEFISTPPLLGDLVPPGGLVVMIVPIDLQAPKGRLILPQVQAIRDALDNDASIVVVKEREYAHILSRLSVPPDLVVCDSQVVMKMVADTPPGIKCTTFSILFARLKGDIRLLAAGAKAIENLKDGDKVLIAEACSHHAAADDIGRVKIPRWLRQYVGADLQVDVYSGRDYPANLADYKLVIHCGGCMLNRREVLSRINAAARANVPVTNYGICISYVQGVLKRVLTPFPAALEALAEK